MKTEKARDIYHRSQAIIAHGALTNSKRPECFVKGVYPTHIKRGFGCELWDIDDKRYIDYICALGTNLVGYANHEIQEAVVDQLKYGTIYSLASELEVQYAERLKGLFPFLEQFRFLKTGSEACSAAVRIARAHTRKNLVVSDGYHGWADDFISLTTPAHGIPHRDWMHILLPGVRNYDVAAYIVEPVITDWSDARISELRKLRELCNETGALLIFDETITGFRVPGYSVASHFGIEPDLIIFGKACGAGFPLSILAGKQKYMSTDYFVSSTFAGDTIALRAAIKLLDLLAGEYRVDRLWDEGKVFQGEFNAINPDLIHIEGYPTRGVFKFKDDTTKALLFQEACKAGYLVGPSFFFNFHHAKYTHQAIAMFQTIISRIANGEVTLEGEIPVTPFAERVRQQ